MLLYERTFGAAEVEPLTASVGSTILIIVSRKQELI